MRRQPAVILLVLSCSWPAQAGDGVSSGIKHPFQVGERLT